MSSASHQSAHVNNITVTATNQMIIQSAQHNASSNDYD